MEQLTSVEIRQKWLDFWKTKNHQVEPSASLVPVDDPTLLWINSGVATLKKYFDGSVVPDNPRITNAQKSIRTNDIENVGKIPSVPVLIQLVRICGLPMERYFNPAVIQNESELRQRVSHKLKLCPEEYLTIVEGTIDGAISLNERSDT